mmetsp:Transcript_70938/g.148398  ORF Transcript_70938/g.148398 Transcript_70938/m.148398 type:complete len:453 (-) Transcript_70938:206-1564(-)
MATVHAEEVAGVSNLGIVPTNVIKAWPEEASQPAAIPAELPAVLAELDPANAPEVPLPTKTSALSVPEATFLACNFVLNFGLFSVPYAFTQSGYCTVGLVFVAGYLCYFTARFLGEVFEELRNSGVVQPCFADAAIMAGGKNLVWVVHITSLMELWTYAIGNVIVLGRTMNDLLPSCSYGQLVIISCTLTLALSGLPDRAYAYISFFAATGIIGSCAIVLAWGFELPDHWAASTSPVVGPANTWAPSMGILLFGAACHPVLPLIFNGTKSRRDFEKAARNGWIFWAIASIVLGAGAHYLYGSSAQKIITQNIGKDLDLDIVPNSTVVSAFSAALLVLRLQGGNVPVTRPMVLSLARIFNIELPPTHGGPKVMALSAPVLAIVGISAWLLKDHMTEVEHAAASLLMCTNAFFFPAIAYWRICRPAFLWDKVKVFIAALSGFSMISTMSASYIA